MKIYKEIKGLEKGTELIAKELERLKFLAANTLTTIENILEEIVIIQEKDYQIDVEYH